MAEQENLEGAGEVAGGEIGPAGGVATARSGGEGTDLTVRSRKCHARAKATGASCGRWAMHGSAVCWVHGGAAGQVRRKAAARMEKLRLEGEIGALLEEIGLQASHPVEVLLDVVHQAHSMATLCGWLVAGLSSNPDGEDGKTEAIYGDDHLGDARPHVLVEMHRKWLETAARSSKLAIEAGVAERQIRLAEAQAGQMASVLRNVTSELFALLVAAGVDAELVGRLQRDELPAIARAQLLAVVDTTAEESSGAAATG